MSDAVRGTVRALVAAVLCAAGGYAGFLWFDSIKRDWHSGLLGASAALVTIAITIALQVIGKLDKVLEAADKFEVDVYVAPVYRYIDGIRRRLVYSLVVAACGGVLNTAIAVAVLKPKSMSWFVARDVTALGYASLTFIVFFAFRVLDLYLRVDGFRREIVDVVSKEKKRSSVLLELKRPIVKAYSEHSGKAIG